MRADARAAAGPLLLAAVLFFLAGTSLFADDRQPAAPGRAGSAAAPSALLTETPADSAPARRFDPLSVFYGAKLGFSLLLAGTAVTDADSSGTERALVGGASLLVGIPSAAVLYNTHRGSADAVRGWRVVSFAADLALSASLAGYGVYLVGDGGADDQWAGLTAISVGLLGAMVSGIDLIPFRFERQVRSR